MSTLPKADRVAIWNAFFTRAFADACEIATTKGFKPAKQLSPSVVLSNDDRLSLLLLASCVLAVEARCNHLVDELAESGRISEEEASAIQHLPARSKWFMLPRLVGSRRKFDAGKSPHRAIAEICGPRNILVHVNYAKLRKSIPPAAKMLNLFGEFVLAMEDLNVTLRRTRRPRRAVTDASIFR